jgi:drug/metabolite transporter (DMT)-like permease
MTHTRTPLTELVKRGGIALLLSLLANGLIVWAVTTTDAVAPYEPLAYPPVFLLTAAGAVGATVAYALVDRWSDRPDRTFAIVVVVVLLLSFVPDVTVAPTLPGATTAGIAVLMAMHVTVAAICYAALTR